MVFAEDAVAALVQLAAAGDANAVSAYLQQPGIIARLCQQLQAPGRAEQLLAALLAVHQEGSDLDMEVSM